MKYFYVSVIDDATGRYNLLAGPYSDHSQAESEIASVRKVASELDARAHWYAFGTCSVEDYSEPGFLNKHGYIA